MRTPRARSTVKRFAAVASILVAACGGAAPAAVPSPAPSVTPSPIPSPERPEILLATTTSTQDSGLLDVLIPDFERRTGYKVKATAVGTGAALAIGAKGDADVLLVHAIASELEFMAAGNGGRRILVMHNDFILVGPAADPAKAKGRPILDALRAIASAQVTFISRGDKSGTDILEKALFQQAGIRPAAPWYVESGTGMGQSLLVASEKKAYVIADRATYLARREALALDLMVEGGAALLNPYHVITVNAVRSPRVNAKGADAFADFVASEPAQRLIADFGKDRYGQPLFFADAGKRIEDLR